MNTATPLNIVYSDLNAKAYLTPFDIVTNVDEAVQRMLLVFATPKRTRWKRPGFGCFISRYLFDPMDIVTTERIRNEIEDAMTDPENDLQDISLDKLEVVPDYDNQNYYVKISISIPTLQQSKTVEFGLRAGA